MTRKHKDSPMYMEKLQKIRELIDNPLFSQIIADIRMDLALEAQNSSNATHREGLYHEGQCLKRLESRLMEMANQARGTTLIKDED